MTAGRKRNLIVVQRGTPSTDDYGGETLSWATLATEWAEIHYGRGDERRAAAMEQGSLSAVFVVNDNIATRSATLKDRISFAGGFWDVIQNVPGDPGDRELTAVRGL